MYMYACMYKYIYICIYTHTHTYRYPGHRGKLLTKGNKTGKVANKG